MPKNEKHPNDESLKESNPLWILILRQRYWMIVSIVVAILACPIFHYEFRTDTDVNAICERCFPNDGYQSFKVLNTHPQSLSIFFESTEYEVIAHIRAYDEVFEANKVHQEWIASDAYYPPSWLSEPSPSESYPTVPRLKNVLTSVGLHCKDTQNCDLESGLNFSAKAAENLTRLLKNDEIKQIYWADSFGNFLWEEKVKPALPTRIKKYRKRASDWISSRF